MNERAREVYEGMKEAGVDFVASVPCVYLKDLLELIEKDDCIVHVPVTREEEGVGICAGAYMGGRRPALLMQNSGLGNCLNALASLNLLYGIPLLMIISHRGVEGERVSAQVPMGYLTEPLLELLRIPALKPAGSVRDTIRKAEEWALRERLPAAVLFTVAFWRST
jgi:sulfopyruvate decarboxylase subunit alpha